MASIEFGVILDAPLLGVKLTCPAGARSTIHCRLGCGKQTNGGEVEEDALDRDWVAARSTSVWVACCQLTLGDMTLGR